MPFWYTDKGWREQRPADPRLPILVWSLTQHAEDRTRIERIPGQTSWDTINETGWGDEGNVRAWYRYINGHLPTFPEQILQMTQRHMAHRLAQIRSEPTDPHQWPAVSRWENDVHHWLNRNPVSCEGLVQTLLGTPMPIYHGGLLHAQISYFDEAAARPGLPPDVAALVEQVDEQGVVVQLINLNPLRSTVVRVKGGAFGEHVITLVTDLATGMTTEVNDPILRVELAPVAGLRVRLDLQRFARTPAYQRT